MLRGVLLRLQYIVGRGRHRMDPPGCGFCGAPAGGALCSTCEGMLQRLSERFPKPSPAPVAPDPPNLERMRPLADLNRRTDPPPARERLPYADED